MLESRETRSARPSAGDAAWAAELLNRRCGEISVHLNSALEPGNIEAIHAMRVATRRLRSAIRDLSPLLNRRSIKVLRRDLRRLANSLGAVRDIDVAIEVLTKLHTRSPDTRIAEGLSAFIADREIRRGHALGDLKDELDGSLMSKIENLCSAILCDSARNGRKEPSSFSEVGGEVIRARLRDLRKRARSLYDPFDIVAHHRLRIAVKRLRYSVQLFSEAFEGDSETVSREIARMQRHLGEMHDCDVWLRGLKKYMNRRPNHREAESKNLAAAEWLIAEFAAERGKAYRDAVELWARWRSDRFPERIESLAS